MRLINSPLLQLRNVKKMSRLQKNGQLNEMKGPDSEYAKVAATFFG